MLTHGTTGKTMQAGHPVDLSADRPQGIGKMEMLKLVSRYPTRRAKRKDKEKAKKVQQRERIRTKAIR